MGKHNLTLPLLLILVIFVMSSPGIIFAQQPETENTEPTEIPVPDYCGENTIPSIENPKVCVAICGDGTSLTDGKCLPSKGFFDLTDNAWIGWGVLTAAVIAGFGILITFFQQKKESQKRTHEIIQAYSSKITEITNKEGTLKTKQDCALYAEQYLDTLEEISTLALAGNFNRGVIINRTYKHVTNYFNNNFAYGYDLWWWYHKEIHGFKDAMQDRLWDVPKKTKIVDYSLEDIYTNKEIRKMKDQVKKLDALQNFARDDRWPDFRKLCKDNEITEFVYNYEGLEGKDDSKKNWRVLPDLMYYNYEDIPDEDGLSKSEYVGILRQYANDLSGFVEKEKDMVTDEQFEVYAEQYIETLEQIATLYKHNIIPRKAKEYFDNKFAYGCNLWNWYHHRVLKFSNELCNALWKTFDCYEDVKDQKDNAESKSEKSNRLLNNAKIKLEKAQDPNNDSPVDENEIKKLKKEIKKAEEIFQITNADFQQAITNANDDKIKANNYYVFRKNYSIDNIFLEYPDMWKYINLYIPDNDKFKDIKNRVKAHAADAEKFVVNCKEDAYNKGQELVSLLLKTPPANSEDILKVEEELVDEEEILDSVIYQFAEENSGTFDPDTINLFLPEFVDKFLDVERWPDFRWWCSEQGITAFEEDETEGLILPLKMWQAQYL